MHWAAKMKIKNIIASNIFANLACGIQWSINYLRFVFFFCVCCCSFRFSYVATANLYFFFFAHTHTHSFCSIQNIIMIYNMLLYVLWVTVCTVHCTAHATSEHLFNGIVNSNTYYFSSIYLIINSSCTWFLFLLCALLLFVVEIAHFARGCWCNILLLIYIYFESANGK